MSYIDRYNKFIDSLKDQEIIGQSEVHHIIPRSMGGSNESSNLIRLTPRQHYIAHWMLWKAYGGKMAQAFFFLNNATKKIIGSRAYAKLREEALDSISGENHYLFGKSLSEETRKKRSEQQRQFMANPKARENLRKHRATQVIPKEAYIKQAEVISSLVWLNDGIRSYRIKPELVEQKLAEGLKLGRLMNHITEDYKKQRRALATEQWKKTKLAGHNKLVGV